MVLLVVVILIGVTLLAILGYVAMWMWKKGPYGRVTAVGLAVFSSYHAFIAVFPRDSFYREEFEYRTGLAMPTSAKLIFKKASYPDFHGDYASAILFEVSKDDFAWLEKALGVNARAVDGAIGGMFSREAEARYGSRLEPIGSSSIRKRDSDERGAWALLKDGKTVYFWFVQT